ncbi:MAG: galactokinase [Ruminococcaceae bacterium]|nr:galactokinase [Oscillospiraceae bacterium]
MTQTELKQEFIKLYGEGGDIRLFHSPGRVNLIGEHTDYNGGFVFPAALSMGTTIALRKRDDNIVRMKATDLPDMVTIDLSDLSGYKDLFWGNYQAGVLDELKKDGYTLVGCDMLYDDTLPHGGGLSSSAAIQVSTALTFATLAKEAEGKDEPVDMVAMAKIGQRSEHNYIGVKCGIMDQFASAMGKKNHAIFLRCSDLSYELVPMEMDGYTLIISNTNKKRGLADSKYNERRSECEEGLRILQTVLPDIKTLSDVSLDDFNKYGKVIENEVVYRRVRHVISENDRVLKSVEALKSGDMKTFGALMNASHDSLRDDYEVTGIELDTLVSEARNIPGVIGSRMTGAGFGGCTVTLAETSATEEFIEKVGKAYEAKIGYAASFYLSTIEDGGHEIF